MNVKIWTLELRSQCLHLHKFGYNVYYSVYIHFTAILFFFFFTDLLNFPLLVPLNPLFCYGQAVIHD